MGGWATDALAARDLGLDPPYHVYVGGPYPQEALCGWKLYGPKYDDREGWPAKANGESMAVTRLRVYESLGHFLAVERPTLCDECVCRMAERIGYGSEAGMWNAHEPPDTDSLERPRRVHGLDDDTDETVSLTSPLTDEEQEEMEGWIDGMGEN